MSSKQYSLREVQELIAACIESREHGPWEEFIRLFHRPIAGVVLRTARRWGETSPAILDELVQEIFMKIWMDRSRLFQQNEYHHPDAFLKFIKVLSANVVHDHLKSDRSDKRGAGLVHEDLAAVDPAIPGGATGSAQSIERGVLLRQIDACLRAHELGPTRERDLLIFWLYYRHGMTAQAIASIPPIGLSTKGVESRILRLVRLVRRELAEARALNKLEGKGAGPEGFPATESL